MHNFKKVISYLIISVLISILFSEINIGIANVDAASVTALETNQVYYIRNQKSGLYMDVEEAWGSNGAVINQYTGHKKINQQFKLVKIGTDIWAITPLTNLNSRVDVAGNSDSDNAIIHIWENNGTSAQTFKILNDGNGTGSFKILTASSNYSKCLTVSGDGMALSAWVIQFSYSNGGTSDSDHWYFEKCAKLENNEYYKIKNQKSGLYLDVQEGMGLNGTLLNQNTANNSNQKFRVVRISEDYYNLIPLNNTLSRVDIAGNSNTNGAAVDIWQSNNSDAQKFKIADDGNGTGSFKILTASSSYGKCLTVRSGSLDAGAHIVQNTYHNSGTNDIDHWYFEKCTNIQIENGSTYLLKNQKSGLYMDVVNYSGDNGAELNQYHMHQNTNQQFFCAEWMRIFIIYFP